MVVKGANAGIIHFKGKKDGKIQVLTTCLILLPNNIKTISVAKFFCVAQWSHDRQVIVYNL